MTLTTWTLPLLCIVGGLLLGAIADVLLRTSIRAAARVQHANDDVILAALRRKPLLWGLIGGLYAAMTLLPFKDDMRRVLGQALLLVLLLSMTLVSARVAAELVGRATAGAASGSAPAASSTSILTNLTRILVLLVGVLMMFQVLQIPITPILTTLGIGGLAVALALQDTLANLFSGIYIILSKKIRVGDYIKLQSGEEGYVIDINLRHTTVREPANNMIIIPNSQIATSINRNYYLPTTELAVPVEVLVGYDADLARVEQVALEVARATLHEVAGGVASFEPVVRFNTFAELGVKFNVILRAQEVTDQHLLRHEFIKRLHQRFQAEQIALPSLDKVGYAEGRKRD